MVPPPGGDQDWQFDKFNDGGSKGILAIEESLQKLLVLSFEQIWFSMRNWNVTHAFWININKLSDVLKMHSERISVKRGSLI